jgi:hypothetical protein
MFVIVTMLFVYYFCASGNRASTSWISPLGLTLKVHIQILRGGHCRGLSAIGWPRTGMAQILFYMFDRSVTFPPRRYALRESRTKEIQ